MPRGGVPVHPGRVDERQTGQTPQTRRQRFERDHPRLWASRHVVKAVAGLLLPLLGIGLFLRHLLAPLVQWVRDAVPDLDLPRLPSIPWPDVPWPDVDLPDLHAPSWVGAVLAVAKYVVPVLIAVAVARHEVVKRQRPRDDEQSADEQTSESAHCPDDSR